MLRRKLFAYTLMLISGIIIGYYICEKGKILIAYGLLFFIFLIIRNIDIEVSIEKVSIQKIVLVACLVLGFFVFVFSYIGMNEKIEEVSEVSGRVISIKTKDDSYRFVIDETSLQSKKKIEVSYYNELEISQDMYDLLGARVSLFGKLKEPAGQDNPACFDYRLYQFSKGIRYNFSAKNVKVDYLSDGLFWKYKKAVSRCRDSFLSEFDDEPEIRAFIKGVIFGDKSELSDETIEEFNENSTGHILAVSGLHIGFLFALLKFLTKKSRSKWSTVLIVAVLLMYGEMTGWSPSTVRATLVLGISLMAVYARRTPDLLTSVSAAALSILLWNPYMLFNSGFQMSFMALLGLVFFAGPLEYFLGKYLAPLIAIQLSVGPLIAFSFSRFNFVSFLINIPIVYLASLLVPLCIISLFVMLGLGFLPGPLNFTIDFLSNIVIKINSILSFDGFFSVNVRAVNVGVLLAFYLIAFFLGSEWFRVKMLRSEKRPIKKMISYFLIISFLVGVGSHNQFLNDEIVFVSVGQGDCMHIRCGDQDVLIDGGGSRDYNVGKNTLRPYLLKNGAKDLDAGIVTHLHTDHFQGLFELCEVFNVKSVVVPNMQQNCVKSENMPDLSKLNNLCKFNGGDEINLKKSSAQNEEVYIKSIWPMGSATGYASSNNANENNMVYIVYYLGVKIMVTGDLVSEDEERMIDYYKGTDVLDCDILKVGHHGSKTSSSEEFIDAVSPDIAVISVGVNNMYGHPNQETLDKLAARGIRTYRTDLNGAVGIDIRKSGLKVDTMR